MNEMLHVTTPGAVDVEPIDVPVGSDAAAPNPLKQLHDLLRGRYWLAITLAVLGLAVGGVGGYFSQRPTYQSTGLIRIKPNLPRILYQNEQNGVMPMFDAFVESQVSLVQSQRVIDLAMQNPDWAALKRGLDPEQVLAFTNSLEVSHPKGGELIVVQFTDRDPTVAMVGVRAVIDAYRNLYPESDAESGAQTMQVLEERQTALNNDLKAKMDEIYAIANQYGSGSLDKIHDFKLQELNKLESQLRQAQLAVALAQGKTVASPTTVPAAPVAFTLTPELLATKLPEMRQLLNDRMQLERRIQADSERLGSGHPSVLSERADFDAVAHQVNDLMAAHKDWRPEELAAAAGASGSGIKTLEQLQTEEKSVSLLYEKVRQETLDLGQKALKVQALREDADLVRAKLDETRARKDQINVESSTGGRITVVSRGDRPLAPLKDKRIAFAGAGGAGMAGLGVGIVALLGWFDRRVRHVTDVAGPSRSRIIGVLPTLPDDLSDPQQALTAAHAVHQIRTRLQRRRQEGERPAFAITSPSPGSGKTSLALALGMSFAASGSNTLLIDCDMVGGGLTAKMKWVTRRRLGYILRRQGLISSEQLNEALADSRRSHKKLGEVLVENGALESDEIESALDVQHKGAVGLREILRGEPAQECITRTGTPGLFLLPLGSADRQHVGELSYASTRRLIDQLRRSFDVIIIDTGPILGSIEASVVTLAADEVVLTVSRGEERPTLERAVEHLRNSGVDLAGVVLNRADPLDIQSSGFSSSTSATSGSAHEWLDEPIQPTEHRFLRLGPIASAVAASTSSSSN